MRLAFVEAAKAVSTEGLHDADVDVGVVMLEEGFAVDVDVMGERIEIVIEELLAEFGWEIGLGVVEERGDVVLEGAFAAALVIDEIGLAVAEHDVAGLEVAIEKKVARGAEKKIGEAAEIVFEGVFVERNAGETEKIIFEIVEIPGDGLAVEAADGIADGVVEIAAGFDLKARESGDNFAVGVNDGWGDFGAGAIFGEKFEERGVAEVFFEIGAAVEIFGVDFGDGEAVAAEVFGEREEGGVFFADVVEDAYGGGVFGFVGEADDFAAGAAEVTLERLDERGRRVEMLLEERFEDVHESSAFQSFRFDELTRLIHF